MLLVEHISDTSEFYPHKKIKLSKKNFVSFPWVHEFLEIFYWIFQVFQEFS